MKAILKSLHELQQVDLQISQARETLAKVDDGAKMTQQINEAEKHFARIKDKLISLQTELKDGEMNLQSLDAKKESYRKRLYDGSVTNAKELLSMEKEIEALDGSRKTLEERLLKLYESVASQQEQADKWTTGIAKLKEHLSKLISNYKGKSTEINGKLDLLNAKRRTIVEKISDDSILQKYEAIRSRHKDSGLAVVENGKCGGCHTALTPFVRRQLEITETYCTCENCGRILFSDE